MAGVATFIGRNLTCYVGTSSALIADVASATSGPGQHKIKPNLAVADIAGASKIINTTTPTTNLLEDVVEGFPIGPPSAPVSWEPMGEDRARSLQGIVPAQNYPLAYKANFSSDTDPRVLLVNLAIDAQFAIVFLATKGSVADAIKTSSPDDATFLVGLCTKLAGPVDLTTINDVVPVRFELDLRDTAILHNA